MPKHHSRGLTPAGRVLCWAVHEPPASAGASVAAGRAVKCLGSTGHVKPWVFTCGSHELSTFRVFSLNHSTWLGWPCRLLVSPASGSPLFIPFFLHPLFLSL